jgi:hypothetical protein
MEKSNVRILIQNLIIELLIYGVLLVIYFFAVLRFMGNFLTNLFHTQNILYALVGLAIIIVQAVLLEIVSSYIMRLLRLERLH